MATLAPKISKDDSLIDWYKDSKIIHNQIRAFSPQPGAHTFFHNKRMKLYNSEIKLNETSSTLQPGQIHYINRSLVVGTGAGTIHIHEIQQEGKKTMSVSQFIAGHSEIIGDFFG